MKKETLYVSNDGIVFKDEESCKKHEGYFEDLIKHKYGTMYEFRQHIYSATCGDFEDYGVYCDEYIEAHEAHKKFVIAFNKWMKRSKQLRRLKSAISKEDI